jgi:hypothetical protein
LLRQLNHVTSLKSPLGFGIDNICATARQNGTDLARADIPRMRRFSVNSTMEELGGCAAPTRSGRHVRGGGGGGS